VAISVNSPEITRASLHVSRPWKTRIYGFPFLSLHPVLTYAYYIKYDEWLVSKEWTFLACVSLGVGHALSLLITKWSTGARAFITTRTASSIEEADCIRIVPNLHCGSGDIVELDKRDPTDPSTYTFNDVFA
ncbi:hypothetical protein BDZ94DRAFT_1361545, partial [Collybia nuda]